MAKGNTTIRFDLSNPMNNTFYRAVADRVAKLSSNFLRHSASAANLKGNDDLEHVFEQISSLVQGNQSQIVNTVDKFSNSTAHALVTLFQHRPMLIDYAALIALATSLVAIGCFASISSIPYTALPPTQLHPLFDPSDLDLSQDCRIIHFDDKKKGFADRLDEKQAIILPLSSGVTLVTLYFVITKLKIEWRTYLLKLLNFNIIIMTFPAGVLVYHYFASCFTRHVSHWGSWNPLMISPRYRVTISDDNEDINSAGWFVHNFQYRDALTNELGYKNVIDRVKEDSSERQFYLREFSKPKDVKSTRQFANMYLTNGMLIASILSLITSACYVYFPNDWLVKNIVSMNFAVWAISQLKLKNLKSGVLILTALFFYDIYFVFGTKVMTTVAMHLDLPIKLSMPTKFDEVLNRFEFSMLGLGDIVLPSMFIALCYKYDIWRWHYVNTDSEFHLLNWGYVGRYFITAILSYIAALATCLFALTTFGTAQPALLYIVPLLLLSTITVAWLSGDLAQFWTFQYDTIELGENKLENDKDKEALMTYSDYLKSDLLSTDNDDNEEYTNQDAIIDYESDDYDEGNDADGVAQVAAVAYRPTDIMGLLDEATKGSDKEDEDFVLEDDDEASESSTVVLADDDN